MMDWHDGVEILEQLNAMETGISSGKIGHLSPMQTLNFFSVYNHSRAHNWDFSGQLGCGVSPVS